MVVQANLTMLSGDINALHGHLYNGYRVLLCTEDPMPPDILVHPNVMKVSVLLPPFEAISLESNNQFDAAMAQYFNYLMTSPEAVALMDIIYISALKGTPLVLFMGSEANDLITVQQLPRYFNDYMGMQFNPYGPGYLNTDVAPRVLTQEYLTGNFTGMQILSFYPVDMDLTEEMIAKLTLELCPPILPGNYDVSNNYFKDIIRGLQGKSANQYGQQYYCPFKGGSFAANGGNQK